MAEALAWYNEQSAELTAEFSSALRNLFQRIEKNPRLYPRSDYNFRSAMCGRFPYRVAYEIVGEDVFVVAIAHTSRDPQAWRDRL